MSIFDTNRPIFYDWATFTLTNGQSDYDVKTNVAALFSNVPYAKNIFLYSTKEIGVKFNSTLMPKITMPLVELPFRSPDRFLTISNLYLSNASGGDSTVKVFLW